MAPRSSDLAFRCWQAGVAPINRPSKKDAKHAAERVPRWRQERSRRKKPGRRCAADPPPNSSEPASQRHQPSLLHRLALCTLHSVGLSSFARSGKGSQTNTQLGSLRVRLARCRGLRHAFLSICSLLACLFVFFWKYHWLLDRSIFHILNSKILFGPFPCCECVRDRHARSWLRRVGRL